MSNSDLDTLLPAETVGATEDSSFADILSNFEREHYEKPGETLNGSPSLRSSSQTLRVVARSNVLDSYDSFKRRKICRPPGIFTFH